MKSKQSLNKIEKEFRIRSWWKASFIRWHIISIILTVALLLFLHIIQPLQELNVLLLFIASFIIIFSLGTTLTCFYVVLKQDKLILQNRIWSFWRKEFNYKDIEFIRFTGAHSYIWPNLSIRKKGRKRLGWHYIINLVADKDYVELIQSLRANGVLVNISSYSTNLIAKTGGNDFFEKREPWYFSKTKEDIVFRISIWQSELF